MNWELNECVAYAPPVSYDATWETIPEHHDAIIPFLFNKEYVMMFSGGTGTGKTWAAWAVIDLYHKITFTGRSEFIEWSELNFTALDCVRSDEIGYNARNRWAALENAELLIIDEFCDYGVSDYGENEEYHLINSLINYRLTNKMRTLFVTTQMESEIKDIMGAEMLLKLKSGITISFSGVDRRIRR